MNTVRNFKLVTAVLETILAIPIYGGFIVIAFFWSPLVILLVLHIITLVLSNKQKNVPSSGSISGIFTSLLGWIPFLGMILHIITAILLWIDFSKTLENPNQENNQ